jgi:transcriptional regulator with XRE-family HTH domain
MKTTVRQRLAAELRAELARQQRAQAQLAEAIGVSQATVSRQLRGQGDFTAPQLVAAAEFLGVPLTALLGEPSPSDLRAGAA